tara:strand:- start:129 stop:383 length:255 start_codon:yes stop_codon:yes gene_type:complete
MVNTNPIVYCESINKETLIPLKHGSTSDILTHAALNNDNIDVAVSCLDEFKRRYDNNMKTDKASLAANNQRSMNFIRRHIIKSD